MGRRVHVSQNNLWKKKQGGGEQGTGREGHFNGSRIVDTLPGKLLHRLKKYSSHASLVHSTGGSLAPRSHSHLFWGLGELLNAILPKQVAPEHQAQH